MSNLSHDEVLAGSSSARGAFEGRKLAQRTSASAESGKAV
jgi:hypothetical protein